MPKTIVASRTSTQPGRTIGDELQFIRTYCKPVETQINPEELKYQEWKRANRLDKPLSRAEYDAIFHIYC